MNRSTKCDSPTHLCWASEALENKAKMQKSQQASLQERGSSLWMSKGSVVGSELCLLPNLPKPLS